MIRTVGYNHLPVMQSLLISTDVFFSTTAIQGKVYLMHNFIFGQLLAKC
jgi:hypothetical protein